MARVPEWNMEEYQMGTLKSEMRTFFKKVKKVAKKPVKVKKGKTATERRVSFRPRPLQQSRL